MKADTTLHFTATILQATEAPGNTGSSSYVQLPNTISEKLPSRGMTSVEVDIEGHKFLTTLEPNGQGSHLLRLSGALQTASGMPTGRKVAIEVTPTEKILELTVPKDLQKALATDLEAQSLWSKLTAKARRDWIHWIASAKQQVTRRRRIEQTCSKLRDGKKRPCCFNYQSAIVSYE